MSCIPGGLLASTDIDQVVVSATRNARSVIDAPVRVEVVTADELARTHSRSLKEALENVVGLQLREIHGKSGYEAALQGMTGDQVLVLIDGQPISASTGSTVDVSQLALSEVERIEIVKGATSAQFGSAAMGGVINVITRQVASGWKASVLADGGSYGEQNPSGDAMAVARRHAQVRAEAGSDTWRGRVALDQLASDGFDPDPGSWARPGDELVRQQVDSRLEWHGKNGARAFAGVGVYDEDIDSRYVLVLPGGNSNQRKEEQVRRLRLTTGAAIPVGAFGWQWSALHERFANDTLKFAGSTAFDDRQADISVEQFSTQLALPASANQEWLVGADWRRDALSQFKDGTSEIAAAEEVSRYASEAFVQHSWYPSARWEWLSGVRYQDDSDFGGHAVAKLGVRWHAFSGEDWRTTVRAGAGQGYRVPNLKERYYLFDHSQLGYVVIGNPDLQPEESLSYQLGTTLYWRDSLIVEAGIYWNELTNLIQIDSENPATGPGGISEFSYDNVGRARTYGVESGVTWRVAPRLRIEAGYTWLQAENLQDKTELTRRPEHQARLSVDHDISARTTLTLRGRYQSTELVSTDTGARSPTWAVADLKLNHAISDKMSIFLGIDNLTNQQREFSDPADFSPLAGRFVYLGARYQLKGEKP